MSKVQAQTEFDTKSFISSLDKLKISELEAFARELNGLINRKRAKNKGLREKELIGRINATTLDRAKRERYIELSNLLEDESITQAEHQELLALVEEEETIRNERAKLLIELSQIRNVPLPQVMTEMGLNPPGHG